MADYITLDDLQARYSPSDLAQYDPAAVSAAVSDANGLVDSYVPDVYPRPLPQVPEVLKGAACDIARLRLYQTEAPDFMQKRHDNAIKYLQDVAAQKASLPGATAGAAPESLVFYGCSEPLLSRDALRGW